MNGSATVFWYDEGVLHESSPTEDEHGFFELIENTDLAILSIAEELFLAVVVEKTQTAISFLSGESLGGIFHKLDGWKTKVAKNVSLPKLVYVDALVLFTSHGKIVSGYSTPLWLPYVPKALEEIDIPFINYTLKKSHAVTSKTLESGHGLRDITGEDPTPYMVCVVDISHLPKIDAEHKLWHEESWLHLRKSSWHALLKMSDSFTIHTSHFFGNVITTGLSVHNTDFPEDDLALLPLDVQEIILKHLNLET